MAMIKPHLLLLADHLVSERKILTQIFAILYSLTWLIKIGMKYIPIHLPTKSYNPKYSHIPSMMQLES
jgi:hypothetical protein